MCEGGGEGSVNLFKVTLVAKEVNGCPCLQKKDRFVFQYPKVLEEESTAFPCGACLSAFMPFLIGLSKGQAFSELDFEGHLYLRCPFVKHYVIFEVFLAPGTPSLTRVISHRPTDQDTAFIVEYLNKIPLFRPLPTPSKERIIDYLNVEKFGPGEVIITQGEPGKKLYILLKGRVEIVKKDNQGNEVVLATLGKGECFGEMSLITGDPCSATVRTQTQVSLLSISKEDFEELIHTYPSLNIYFNKLLAQRLRNTNLHIQEQLEKGLWGNLHLISLAELTQTISMNQKTGVLVLKRETEEGKLYFRKGQLIQAQVGSLEGEEAFFELLKWKGGSFRFLQEEPSVPHYIQWDTMALLMEGLRLLDEANWEVK